MEIGDVVRVTTDVFGNLLPLGTMGAIAAEDVTYSPGHTMYLVRMFLDTDGSGDGTTHGWWLGGWEIEVADEDR